MKILRRPVYPCCGGPTRVPDRDEFTRRCPACRRRWRITRAPVSSTTATMLRRDDVFSLLWSEEP